MDGFECKAPMYVDFVDSTLDENDGADKFFDCDEQNASVEVSSVAGGSPSVAGGSAGEHFDGDFQIDSPEQSEDVDGILNLAMKNLWTSTKPKKTRGRPTLKMSSASRIEDYTQKRKGSPTIDNCHARKFISLAEAVSQFQRNTPDRFHTKPVTSKFKATENRTGAMYNKTSTIPRTPRLTSHLRSRPVQLMTREEEEEKEIEEMKLLQVRANPLNPKVLGPPKLGVKVERKQPTVPVPFNLTEIAKKKAVVPPIYTFTANPVPSGILESTKGIPKKKELPLTNPVSPACYKSSRVYAVSLDVKDGIKCLTEKTVHHFGIPTTGTKDRKHTTEVQPFSFEERDKQMLKKKEETIQKYLLEEKKAREFHAKPVPSYVKSPRPHPQKENSIGATEPVPFRFELERRGMSKQELFKLKLEEEEKELKQASLFRAQPALVIKQKPFEPKKSDRPLTDITAVELNTEKRAKEREEFDIRTKKYNEELDELRRLRDEEIRQQEMEEVARLRKEAVHKANPVRRYRPLEISSSDKQLTDPQSPSFGHFLKKN